MWSCHGRNYFVDESHGRIQLLLCSSPTLQLTYPVLFLRKTLLSKISFNSLPAGSVPFIYLPFFLPPWYKFHRNTPGYDFVQVQFKQHQSKVTHLHSLKQNGQSTILTRQTDLAWMTDVLLKKKQKTKMDWLALPCPWVKENVTGMCNLSLTSGLGLGGWGLGVGCVCCTRSRNLESFSAATVAFLHCPKIGFCLFRFHLALYTMHKSCIPCLLYGELFMYYQSIICCVKFV